MDVQIYHHHRRSTLRKYHFAATLLALGAVLWGLSGVLIIEHKVDSNLEQTHCNQGLLVLALYHKYDFIKLDHCPPDIKRQLQGTR